MKTQFLRFGLETVARLILVMALALLAAACNQSALTPSPVPNPVTGQNPGDVEYYPSDQPVRLGTQRFYDGNSRLAQQYFQDAVEKSPEDVMAGSDWRRVTIDWGGSSSQTTPTRLRRNSRVKPRGFSITKVIRICCAATLKLRGPNFIRH